MAMGGVTVGAGLRTVALRADELAAPARRVQALLPHAVHPDWLRATFAGTHGSAGLISRVDETTTRLFAGRGGMTATAEVNGTVLRGSDDAGAFVRIVDLHGDGRLGVYHAYLGLYPSAQGTGFARSFNDRAFARYAEAGIDRVTVTASLDVGGYAWARQGFELAVDGADEGERALNRARGVRELVSSAFAQGRISDDEMARLAPRLVGADRRITPHTLTSVQDLASIDDVGKRVLLGNSWSGVREVHPMRSWLDTMGAGGATDAARAPRLVDRAGGTRGMGVDDARRGVELGIAASGRIRAQLPGVLDPARGSRLLVDATDGQMRMLDEHSYTVFEHLEGTPSVAATYGFDLATPIGSTRVPRLHAVVAADPKASDLVAVRQVLRGDSGEAIRLPADLRARLDDAWRRLGVGARVDGRGSVHEL